MKDSSASCRTTPAAHAANAAHSAHSAPCANAAHAVQLSNYKSAKKTEKITNSFFASFCFKKSFGGLRNVKLL